MLSTPTIRRMGFRTRWKGGPRKRSIPPIIKRLLVITTRGDFGCNILGGPRTASNVKQRFRKQVFVGQGGLEADTIRLVTGSYAVQDSAAEVGSDGYEISGHFEVDGVAYPFSWGDNNAPTGIVPANTALVESNAAVGHPNVSPGTMCYVVITREYAVGAASIFNTAPSTNTAGDSAHAAVAGTDAGIGIPGPKTATGGWSAQSSVFDIPFVLVGHQITTAPAIICIGASVEKGQQDTAGDGTAGGGYIRRGLNPPGGVKQAFALGAKRGESLSSFIASSSYRVEYMKYANTLLLGFGGNDFTNGVSVETASELLRNLDDMAIAAGITRRALLGMVIKTDTQDSWATIEGQTPRVGFFDYRDAFHAAAIAKGMSVIDTSAAWQHPTIPVWKANGTANWSTSDGTHPTIVRHQDAGILLPTQLGPLLIWP